MINHQCCRHCIIYVSVRHYGVIYANGVWIWITLRYTKNLQVISLFFCFFIFCEMFVCFYSFFVVLEQPSAGRCTTYNVLLWWWRPTTWQNAYKTLYVPIIYHCITKHNENSKRRERERNKEQTKMHSILYAWYGASPQSSKHFQCIQQNNKNEKIALVAQLTRFHHLYVRIVFIVLPCCSMR